MSLIGICGNSACRTTESLTPMASVTVLVLASRACRMLFKCSPNKSGERFFS